MGLSPGTALWGCTHLRRQALPGFAAFGFSRPTYYDAEAALESGGLPALVPAKPGPRGAHKMRDEVVDFVAAIRAEDPTRRPGELAEAVLDRFGSRVHPRSVERALLLAFRLHGLARTRAIGRSP